MTFSLAARCARTGMFGAAVTTSSIAVGSRCPFAAAGVGAALTQHMTDPRLGPLMLDRLRRGDSAQQAVDAAIADTPGPEWRQLAVIDNQGRTASYSGANVRAERGEAHGRDCVAIANIVRSHTIPAAMIDVFEREPDAPLGLRLIGALEAGHAAGSEPKPLVSACLTSFTARRFPMSIFVSTAMRIRSARCGGCGTSMGRLPTSMWRVRSRPARRSNSAG